MEKTEEFNVLELQELVLRHNCGKKHTSLAQKSIVTGGQARCVTGGRHRGTGTL